VTPGAAPARVVVGLDGEMSGTRPARHRLIQIGVCAAPGDVFASSIGWDDLPYEPEALRALGLSVDEAAAGPPAGEVDERLFQWLRERGVQPRSLVATGWRVSTFDIPFVVRALPKVTGLLSHHTVELNALCYTYAGAVPYRGGVLPFDDWKRLARVAAETYLVRSTGKPAAWHDAGFDAEAAMLQFMWLRSVAAGTGVPAEEFVPGTGGT
jgi:DNA polymerase III epsilon subunit-like protein